MRNKTLQKILVNGAVVLGSFLIIFILLEIGVRMFGEPVYPIVRSDRRVGSIHEKNFSGEIWNSESQSWNYIVTNSLGYVGEEPSTDEDAIRLAFLGDSMTEGLQVNYYDNFVEQLEAALNVSRGQEIELRLTSVSAAAAPSCNTKLTNTR